jgi:hypothetical protein
MRETLAALDREWAQLSASEKGDAAEVASASKHGPLGGMTNLGDVLTARNDPARVGRCRVRSPAWRQPMPWQPEPWSKPWCPAWSDWRRHRAARTLDELLSLTRERVRIYPTSSRASAWTRGTPLLREMIEHHTTRR